jgi:hypothetical protein
LANKYCHYICRLIKFKKMKKIYSLFFLLTIFSVSTANAQVVISQVYGGGGNSGATYTNDFIELFNRGSVAQDLTGWSVQYASATGTSWAVQPLTALTLQPGQYYLIQCAAGATPSTALPTPDSLPVAPATGLAMSGANGKVLLANVTTAQTGLIPTSAEIVDLVGYGATPTGFEGTGPTGTALTSTTAVLRLSGGCTDTNNNAADFSTGLPTPRNTSTPIAVCSSAPSLAISTPLNGTIFNPTVSSVTINIAVSNFTVANGTGSGNIRYSVNGGSLVAKYDTTPIVLNSLTPGSYTVYAELVNNSNNVLSPAVNATVNFSIASFTVVNNIAELRADVIANGYGKYYQLTNPATVTYARLNRNQKYVQDATAGMLIDDVPGTITPNTITTGDALSGLQGQSFNFNGVLEFLPVSNATVSSTGNTITPEVVTVTALTSNIEAYESELVRINGATFAAGDGTATFAVSTDYVLNADATTTFRTLFSEAGYLTAPNNVIPTGANDIVVLVSENNGVARVVARSLSDLTLASQSFEINGLKVYPNPVANGTLFIETAANAERTVTVFDLLGKQVLNTTTSENAINVSNLNAGVYVVKITEEDKTASTKLVIE